jgi:hypothetical protein
MRSRFDAYSKWQRDLQLPIPNRQPSISDKASNSLTFLGPRAAGFMPDNARYRAGAEVAGNSVPHNRFYLKQPDPRIEAEWRAKNPCTIARAGKGVAFRYSLMTPYPSTPYCDNIGQTDQRLHFATNRFTVLCSAGTDQPENPPGVARYRRV